MNKLVALAVGALAVVLAPAQQRGRVGENHPGLRQLTPSGQLIRPAGNILQYGGRPVDIVVLPDGSGAVLKDNLGLTVVRPAPSEGPDTVLDVSEATDAPAGAWKAMPPLEIEDGASMHGIAVTKDATRVYVTDAKNSLVEATFEATGILSVSRTIVLPGVGESPSYPCGIALSTEDSTAYVCLSMKNSLAIVALDSGAVREIPVGMAPYGVLLAPDGNRAYVSNWGGRRPTSADQTAPSAGSEVVVDERGVAATGSVSIVDLQSETEIASIAVGLHPSDLALSRDGATLYVANANSDTVSVIDTDQGAVVATIPIRPDSQLPFGSAPCALALDEDRQQLYVALGGNNAVAVVSLNPESLHAVSGFVPAGWYPGALELAGDVLFVANVKGFGSRDPHPAETGWHVKWFSGALQRVSVPLPQDRLEYFTRQVRFNGFVPQILRSMERGERAEAAAPVPVPEVLGAPSVFEHVVYIIKENRTYDQIFGDLPQGNGEPSLCIFPRDISPNHHALAEEFVLLDNWYCNGVNSADGHAWSTEGNVTDYLEKSFGGFTRSYTWGDDPLSYSSSGFIWDKVLAAGLSFRNYGEFAYTEPVPADATFTRIYEDFRQGGGQIRFEHKIGIQRLRDYSCSDYPGWNMVIPDVLRASIFLRELAAFEAKGHFPNFTIVYLPQDHTSGSKPGLPTPAAHVADNDLALGRIVDGLSKSRFWPKTCIFVVEDDPQDGFDHVDGHRSVCLVASPYSRRGAVVSEFYNQTSVLHTMARILGIPPMNQMHALAPLMTACFQPEPDLTPYTARPANVPLDQLNPPMEALHGPARHWAEQSLAQNFDEVDAGDEDTLNRILWHAMKGAEAPFPAEFAGAHGKGLPALNLVLTGEYNDGVAEDSQEEN